MLTHLCIAKTLVAICFYAGPQLQEIAKHITPKYSSYWKKVGTFLKIEKGRLDAIESNHQGDVDRCCNEMFDLWLSVDHNATWSRIYDAIESECKRT